MERREFLKGAPLLVGGFAEAADGQRRGGRGGVPPAGPAAPATPAAPAAPAPQVVERIVERRVPVGDVFVSEITVNKDLASEAAGTHPKGSQSVLSDLDKLQSGVAEAAKRAAVTAGVGAAAGRVPGVSAIPGVGGLASAGIGRLAGGLRGGNEAGADYVVEGRVVEALDQKNFNVVLVYGDRNLANSVRDLAKAADAQSSTVVLFVNPAAKGNDDFQKHFTEKNGKVVVWPKGSTLETPSAVLNQIDVRDKLGTSLVPAAPAAAAPAAAPAAPAPR